MESILTTIKKMLGIAAADTHFDEDIIAHINAVFATLTQIGVEDTAGFVITGATETWANYSTDISVISFVKPYVYFKVKLAFDPPASSSVTDSFNRIAAELEWRLHNIVDLSEVSSEC